MYVIDSDEPIPCRDTDPEIFFSGVASKIETAKAYCRSCRIRLACLENALEFERVSGERLHGVQGGLTEEERGRTTFAKLA